MFESTWVRVRAPLIPEVALVEFPPKKPEEIIKLYSTMNGRFLIHKPCLSRTRTLAPARYRVWAALRPDTTKQQISFLTTCPTVDAMTDLVGLGMLTTTTNDNHSGSHFNEVRLE